MERIRRTRKVKTVKKELKIKFSVTVNSERCSVCGATIYDRNWFIIATHGEYTYHLHDNDICIAALKVRLGLEKPSFQSSRLSYVR